MPTINWINGLGRGGPTVCNGAKLDASWAGHFAAAELVIHCRVRCRVGPGLGGPVAYYRLYFMDGFTGHIEHFREFEAESDEAAVAYAEDALGNRPMELWCQHRKVMHWDGVQPKPPVKDDSS